MAAYPSALASFTNPAGTSLLTSPDHAVSHGSVNDEIVAIETTLGTNAGGTNILKNFSAGKFVVHTPGGTLATGMVQNGTVGTARMIGGTVSEAIVGTSTVQGGTVAAALVGTSTFTNGTISGGTANTLALGTPTIIAGLINASGTSTPLTMGAALAPNTGGSITDGAGSTFTVNAQANNVFYSVIGTAAGNRTIAAPLNPTAWQTLNFAFKASGSANGTLVWNAVFQFSQDFGTPTLGTGTSWNYYSWRYNPVATKWDFQGKMLNLV